jgi:hypothetical protein
MTEVTPSEVTPTEVTPSEVTPSEVTPSLQVSEIIPDCHTLNWDAIKHRLIHLYGDCSSSRIRRMLVLLNIFYLVCGFVILMLGMWAILDSASFFHAARLTDDQLITYKLNDILDGTPLRKIPPILFTAGAIIILFSSLGYFAAAGERKHLLICYSTTILIIMVMEIIAGCIAIASKNEMRIAIRETIKTTFSKYDYWYQRQDRNGLTLMWDRIMEKFQCCGVDNSTDFLFILDWHTTEHMKVPEACCNFTVIKYTQQNRDNCVILPTTVNSYKDKGCYNSIVAVIKKYTTILLLMVIALLLSQIMGMFLAFLLFLHLQFISKVKHLGKYRQNRRWCTEHF